MVSSRPLENYRILTNIEASGSLKACEPRTATLELVKEICDDLAERHRARQYNARRKRAGRVQIFVIHIFRTMVEAQLHHIAKILCATYCQ